MPDRYVLVLAGGRGERFWPWSRPDRPKQFLPLTRDGRSLLAATLARAQRIAPPERTLVMTGADLLEPTARESPRGVRVLGEPIGRNTAPAIAAAALWVERKSPGAAFAVLPSDHAIDDEAAFTADFERAFAKAGGLLLAGPDPTGNGGTLPGFGDWRGLRASLWRSTVTSSGPSRRVLTRATSRRAPGRRGPPRTRRCCPWRDPGAVRFVPPRRAGSRHCRG